MVRVPIEVRCGAARFNVAVRAASIQRAASIAGARYPGSNVRVRFPIDTEVSFVKDPVASTGLIELGKWERSAA